MKMYQIEICAGLDGDLTLTQEDNERDSFNVIVLSPLQVELVAKAMLDFIKVDQSPQQK